MARIKELELRIKFLEKHIETKKLAEFKNCEVWDGPKGDVEIFKFYKYVNTQPTYK